MSIRFVVSTTNYVAAVDIENRLWWRLHSGQGLYFGLSADYHGRIYAACRNAIFGPENEAVRAAERGSVLVLDSELSVSEVLMPPFPLRDVHGSAFHDHRLWLTCSFDNMVAIFDCRSREWKEWYPVPEEQGRDVHHFNTIRFHNGEIWLVAHRFGPSELIICDYPSLRFRNSIQLGQMAHDLFFLDGALATCSSGEGCVLNTRGDRILTGEFPRGVAITKSGILVGVSPSAARSDRWKQDPVLRWYTPAWEFRADYVLPGGGMILDVLAVEAEQYSWRGLEPRPLTTPLRARHVPAHEVCSIEV